MTEEIGFWGGEITEDITFHGKEGVHFPLSGPADTNFQSIEFPRRQAIDQRLYPVVTAGTTTLDQLNPPRMHIKIVVNNHKVVRWNFEKPKEAGNGIAAQVHIGHRLDEVHFLATKAYHGIAGLPFLDLGGHAKATGKRIDNMKADIVTIEAVLFTGIAKADEQILMIVHRLHHGNGKGPEKYFFSGPSWYFEMSFQGREKNRAAPGSFYLLPCTARA